jgi:hypothetical protein
VRVADGTGIRLDQGVLAASPAQRERLGINRFVRTANSAADVAADVAADDTRPTVVHELVGWVPASRPWS